MCEKRGINCYVLTQMWLRAFDLLVYVNIALDVKFYAFITCYLFIQNINSIIKRLCSFHYDCASRNRTRNRTYNIKASCINHCNCVRCAHVFFCTLSDRVVLSKHFVMLYFSCGFYIQ